MSREIKFEFIWKKKATLVKQVMTLDEIANCVATPRMHGKNMPLIAKRQFTGLKDKNGVEIYEGDVIKGISITEPFSELCNHVVEYCDDRCALMAREVKENHRGGRYWAYWDFLREIEVIGNIHQNKDLLL